MSLRVTGGPDPQTYVIFGVTVPFLGARDRAKGTWDVHTDPCCLWSRSRLLHPLDSL